MKVLLLAPPLGSAGGIQRHTATLVRALKDLSGGQCVRCVAISEVRYGSRHGQFSMRLKLRFGREALWEAVRWRPDLTICTHLGLGPIGWLLANLGRRPYWIVVHRFEAWCLLPYWKRMGLQQADRVIVTSAFSQEKGDFCSKRYAAGW